MLKQVHLYIKGDVIGVGFRAWTKIQAKILGINGWARNNADLVEAVLQGEENKIDELIEKLKKGPPIARVDDIEIIHEKPERILEGFEIRR